MPYLQIDSDRFVKYDEGNDNIRMISKIALQDEIDFATARLAELPDPANDEELLAWARAHYTELDVSEEISDLQNRINDSQEILNDLAEFE